MAIRPRGKAFQIDITVTTPSGSQRYREDWPTEDAAIRREAEIRANAVAGKDITPKDRTDQKLTLQVLQERTYAKFWADAKSARNLRIVSQSVVNWFGPHTLVTSITPDRVDAFVDGLKTARNANATINRKLAALSKMMRFAKARGWIDAMPELHRLKEPTGRMRVFTANEEARVLATLKVWGKDDVHDLFAVLIDTGARVSELLKLHWQDVGTKYVQFIDTKNGYSRSVPIRPRSEAIFAARRAAGLVRPFAVNYGQVNKVWERVRGHLGFANDPQFILHTARHTCLSRFAERGFSEKRIMEWSGHRSSRMVQRYMHLSPTALDAMIEDPVAERPRHLGVVEGGKQ